MASKITSFLAQLTEWKAISKMIWIRLACDLTTKVN